MSKTTTSPKANKVIVIYNDFIFLQMYKSMLSSFSEFCTDASGTIWHIDDVADLMYKRKLKIK